MLYEPNQRFKARKPDDYPEGSDVPAELRVFLFRKGNTFRAVSRRSALISAARSTAPDTAFIARATAACSTNGRGQKRTGPARLGVVSGDPEPGQRLLVIETAAVEAG